MSIEGHDQIVHYPGADYFSRGTLGSSGGGSLFENWIHVRLHELQPSCSMYDCSLHISTFDW